MNSLQAVLSSVISTTKEVRSGSQCPSSFSSPHSGDQQELYYCEHSMFFVQNLVH